MKDIVCVENGSSITVTSKQTLKIRNYLTNQSKYFFPKEIEYLILENSKIYLSVEVLRLLVKNKVAVMICDDKHSPLIKISDMEFDQSERVQLLYLQTSMGKQLKGRIWRKVIKAKVKNQEICVKNNSTNELTNYFEKMYKNIKYGDQENIEAIVARKYFECLFGKNFSRRTDNLINACLNYGYAIIRSAIRKQLVIEGLEPSLEICHRSQKNNFNLADDLIEPFRPILDNLVIDILNYSDDEYLTSEMKYRLVQVLLEKCLVGKHVKYIGDAIKDEIRTFKKCIRDKNVKELTLPQLIEGEL